MTATNLDTFCVSPYYVMPNSWKDSRHITNDSSYYFIRVTRSCCVSAGVSTSGFSCTSRNENPIVSGQVSEEARLLGLHFQSICCQRCHSSGDTTRSCGTNTSSSWSYPGYSGNTQNVSNLMAARLSTFCKWIKWCLLTVFKLSPLLFS